METSKNNYPIMLYPIKKYNPNTDLFFEGKDTIVRKVQSYHDTVYTQDIGKKGDLIILNSGVMYNSRAEDIFWRSIFSIQSLSRDRDTTILLKPPIGNIIIREVD